MISNNPYWIINTWYLKAPLRSCCTSRNFLSWQENWLISIKITKLNWYRQHFFSYIVWFFFASLPFRQEQGLRRTRKLRQFTNLKKNLRICKLAKASNKKNWSIQLVCPAGLSCWFVHLVCSAGLFRWSVQLVCPDGSSSWSVQLVRPAGLTSRPSYTMHLAC